jgi:hypothetical protein
MGATKVENDALLRKKEKKNASFFTPTSVIIGVVAIVVAVCGYMAYTHAIADTSQVSLKTSDARHAKAPSHKQAARAREQRETESVAAKFAEEYHIPMQFMTKKEVPKGAALGMAHEEPVKTFGLSLSRGKLGEKFDAQAMLDNPHDYEGTGDHLNPLLSDIVDDAAEIGVIRAFLEQYRQTPIKALYARAYLRVSAVSAALGGQYQDLVDATKQTDLMDVANKDFKTEIDICDRKGLPQDKYEPEDEFTVPDITHQEDDDEFDPTKMDDAKDEVFKQEHKDDKKEERRRLLGSGFDRKLPSEYTKQLSEAFIPNMDTDEMIMFYANLTQGLPTIIGEINALGASMTDTEKLCLAAFDLIGAAIVSAPDINTEKVCPEVHVRSWNIALKAARGCNIPVLQSFFHYL